MRQTQFPTADRLPEKSTLTAIVLAGILLIVTGCGGSGGGSSAPGGGGGKDNKSLSGTNLDIGVGVTVSKSTVAATVPFSILKAVSPTGVPSFGKPQTTGLTFVPALKLYNRTQISGKTLTTSFYTDSAGSSPAGSLSVVSTEIIGSTYTYPIAFHATGAITSGTVPLTADFTITISDSKGANTLNGKLGLTLDSINMNFAMSLDDSGMVGSGGTITSTYSYPFLGNPVPVTATLTNLSGGPLTAINGSATVDAMVPYLGDQAGTGTGQLDLINGKFTLNITSGALNGLLANYNGGSDTLTVSAGGGFSSVLSNASTFSIASLLKTVTNTGPSYSAPQVIQGPGKIEVEQTLGDGEMVGFSLDASNRTTAYYWPSPTVAPQALPAPTGGSHTSAHGIASYSGQTVIVGSYSNASGTVEPCFWIDTTGTHVFKPYTANGSLPYGGEFEGISANGNTIVGFSYSQNFVQSPVAYVSGTLYSLKSDGRTSNLIARAVDNNNDILGTGDGVSPNPGLWQNATVNQSTGKIDSTFSLLPEYNGISGSVEAVHISDNGVIVGGDGRNGIYWQKSDGFAPHPLAIGSNAGATAYAVNHAGTQAAGTLYAISPATTSDLAFWPTLSGSPVDVTVKLGSAGTAYQNLAGFFILDDGSLIGISSSSSGVSFVYVQKK